MCCIMAPPFAIGFAVRQCQVWSRTSLFLAATNNVKLCSISTRPADLSPVCLQPSQHKLFDNQGRRIHFFWFCLQLNFGFAISRIL